MFYLVIVGPGLLDNIVTSYSDTSIVPACKACIVPGEGYLAPPVAIGELVSGKKIDAHGGNFSIPDVDSVVLKTASYETLVLAITGESITVTLFDIFVVLSEVAIYYTASWSKALGNSIISIFRAEGDVSLLVDPVVRTLGRK